MGTCTRTVSKSITGTMAAFWAEWPEVAAGMNVPVSTNRAVTVPLNGAVICV